MSDAETPAPKDGVEAPGAPATPDAALSEAAAEKPASVIVAPVEAQASKPAESDPPRKDEPAPPSLRAPRPDDAPPVEAAPVAASGEVAPELVEPPPPAAPPSPPAPPVELVIFAVTPANAPLAGGVRVAVRGQGFGPGARVWLGPNSVATNLEDDALVFAAPAGGAGPVTLRVEMPDGRAAELAYAFRYDPAPLAVRLDPDWASVAGRRRATIFGAHIEDGCRVEVDDVDVELERFDGARLEFTVPPHAEGVARAVIVNPDGQRSAKLPLTYVEAPVIEALVPPEGSVDGGGEIAVRGKHFTERCVVTIDGAPAAVRSFDLETLRVELPPRVAGGKVDVRVTEEHGLVHTLHQAFLYRPKPAPVIEVLLPGRGPSGGGTAVAVRGRDFLPGCRVRVFETDLEATFVTPDHLDIVTPSVPGSGPVDVVVTNPDGQAHKLERGFVFDAPMNAPQLAQVSPTRGLQTGGFKVVLLGNDFAEGCEASFGGVSVPVKFLTHKEVHAVAPASSATGELDVEIANPDGQRSRLEAAFFFEAVPPPVIASVSPPNGPTTGGTKVTIEGTNFTDACTILIDRERPQAIPKRSKTELVFVTPPRKSAGVVDVEVIVAGVGNSVKKNAFRYDALPAPAITQVSPNRVGTEGGSELTISGKNFVKESVVLVDGRPVRSQKLVDAQTFEVKTPPGQNGKLADVAVKNPDGKEAVQRKAVQFDARYD